MRIAVTGGNGRFGRVVTRHLAQRGHDLISIDRATNEAIDPAIPFIGLDLTDLAALTKAFEGCDAVIHLAAIPSPRNFPAPEVYINNTVTSYNALYACAELGIKKVCLASSINAIGGAYSRKARYDYFPVDEAHPTYNEDAYSLSKWVLEAQADSFARLSDAMTISSLRFHGIVPAKYDGTARYEMGPMVNHLWAYTNADEAARACELALLAGFKGHEAFFITGPTTVVNRPSLELAHQFYPDVKITGDLSGQRSFYDNGKAQRLLGWTHGDL
jgi:UDP-glucose 4-epimerase